MAITTPVPVPIDATLRVAFDHPAHPDRDATDADLETFGYVSRDELYRHLSRSIAAAATGDPDADLTSEQWADTTANALRYLVEVAIHYAHTPDEVVAHLGDDADDPPTVETYRALLAAHGPD